MALYDKKAAEIFVVMDKRETTVLKDPGMNRPFSTKVRKHAERVARETGGKVVTLDYAIKVLIGKNHKSLFQS